MTRTFSQRMWRAIAFIESGAEHIRQLDEAFENFDGDAMWCALWTMANNRPRLAANIGRYVSTPEQMAHKPERVAMLGKPLPAIRAEAYRQRCEGYAAMLPNEAVPRF